MKTYMFPGQGSQAKGMGKHLFDKYPELTAQADRVLGYSIRELCLEDPRQELGRTQFTQPAIFVVSALAYHERVAESGLPDFVAGHSLGEFNALLAAGCFDFDTGLKLVQRRAQLMGEAAPGAMAAVLNATPARIAEILAANGLDQIDIANLNTPSQTVISGAKEQIARAEECFRGDRMRFVPLNTSGAFHSRFMEPARQQYEAFLAGFDFQPPAIPVIANVTARPYVNGTVAANLGRQITGSVRWNESIAYLLGVDPQMQFTEVGHGEVLTNMLAKIRAETAAAPAATPAPAPAPAAAPAPVASAPAAPAGATALEKVRQWNQKHPVGTRVRSSVVPGVALATRTEAVLLFQHRAAVYVDGYNGYFDLDELAPA
ncbi:MAG: ACP S-malonyltransferase [Gammaproteobacteria bacterium]